MQVPEKNVRILNFTTKQGVSWIKTPVLEDIEEPFDAAMF